MILTKQKAFEYITSLKDEDIVEIKEKRYTRSQLQVKYYWAVIIDIVGDFHGYDPIETNEMLKTTFGVETFTNLDTKKFKELIENIIMIWKNKYGVIIPTPNGGDNRLYASLGF